MRKLIEPQWDNRIVCDNPHCTFEVEIGGDIEKVLTVFVDLPCPRCGENLLTRKDYETGIILMRTVNWINKWFSWITIFIPKSRKYAYTQVHVHDGIKFSNIQEG